MIHPCDTPFQQSAKKAVLDACNSSFATLWNAKILTPESFQSFDRNIDLYTGTRALAWEEIRKLQERLREAGWGLRDKEHQGGPGSQVRLSCDAVRRKSRGFTGKRLIILRTER